MHEYGTTSEHLAEIAVATRQWAALNPAATMRDPLSIEDVLKSPMIADPLHLLDICLVTDGGGAVVMTTAEHAKALGRKPVHVRGYGESHTHWTIAAMPDLAHLTAAEVAGRDAFAMAGIRHDAIDDGQGFVVHGVHRVERMQVAPLESVPPVPWTRAVTAS